MKIFLNLFREQTLIIQCGIHRSNYSDMGILDLPKVCVLDIKSLEFDKV